MTPDERREAYKNLFKKIQKLRDDLTDLAGDVHLLILEEPSGNDLLAELLSKKTDDEQTRPGFEGEA